MPTSKSNMENLLLIVLLAGLAGMLFFRANSSGGDQVTLGSSLPAIATGGWINQNLDPAELSGKVVLIDFFATWCGPCRAKMPALVDLKERMAAQDLQIIGLTSEGGSETQKVADYVTTVPGLDWPVGVGAGKVFDSLRIHMIPSLAVYSRSGKLSYLGHDLSSAEDAVVRELSLP